MTRALAFSGGGVRGIMSAIWLEEVVCRLDDLDPVQGVLSRAQILAGTSTGSIIAALLAVGYKPAEIVSLYRELCAEVFPPGMRWFPLTRRVVRGHLYSAKPLERLLLDHLMHLEFKDLRGVDDLLIASYNVNTGTPYVFSKRDTPNVLLRDACLASSAAATYLPMKKVPGIPDAPSGSAYFEDGGLTRNNPSGAAFSRGADAILSFGTGAVSRLRSNEELAKWGGVKRVANIVPQAMDNAEKTVMHFNSPRMRELVDFIHIDADIPEECAALDDASEANLNMLASHAYAKVGSEGMRGPDQNLFAAAAKLLE